MKYTTISLVHTLNHLHHRHHRDVSPFGFVVQAQNFWGISGTGFFQAECLPVYHVKPLKETTRFAFVSLHGIAVVFFLSSFFFDA